MAETDNRGMAYLHVSYPSGYEIKYKIAKALTRIGRHSANDLQLADDTVSRFHAELLRRQGRYVIRDLQSKNGVLVNEVQITEHQLSADDHVQIGNIAVRFLRDAAESSSVAENVELVHETEDRSGPIVQAKREIGESVVFQDDWARLTTTDRSEVQNRLKTITALCRQLLSFNTPEDLLEETMDLIGRQLPYDRGCIMMTEGEDWRLVPQITRDNRKGESGDAKLAVSTTIANSCLRDRSGVLCTDAVRDSRFSASDSVRDLELHSVLCVPLLGSEGPMGVIHLDSRADRYVFTELDLDFMAGVASELSLGLEHLQLREEQANQQRMAAIGHTIAGLSHHIKNILVVGEGANGVIEEALEANDMDQLRGAWDIVKRNNVKVAELVKDMLLYSKSDKSPPMMGNVNRVIERMVESARHTTEKRGIEITMQLDDRITDGYVNPDSLQRALMNIVLNAVEALDNVDSPAIVIATELATEEQVNILIQDNGLGIPEEERDRVFEPFFSTKGQSGTGLGLALTHKLIVEMGGKIVCESEPGLGTGFGIRLPVPKTPPEPGASTTPAPAAEEEMDAIG